MEIVLRSLQQGEGDRTVELPDGYTYGWEKDNLCLVLELIDRNDQGEFVPVEERWVVCDMPLNYFYDQCEQMKPDDIALIAANTALTTTKRGT